MQEQYYELIDERVYKHELNNGLRLFVIPKKGFQKTYVTIQLNSVRWIIHLNLIIKINM